MERELECLDRFLLFTMIHCMSLDRRAYCRAEILWEVNALRKQLPDGYSVHTQRMGSISGTLRDTFEGHLRSSGQLLVQTPTKLFLLDLVSGDVLEQNAAPGWSFAAELVSGIVADRLLKHSSLRAFSVICNVSIKQRGMAVMDELDKTVVRGRISELSHDAVHTTLVSAVPLRGYDAEMSLFANALAGLGFAAFGASSDLYPLLGIDKEPYTSKPEVRLEWDCSVYESANRIAHTFIGVARRNETGIMDDIDTEFLHDFRVSLRRVRSLLSLFSNVYSAKDCQVAKAELGDIMKQTNRLRDLDVYLMERGSFYALVPDSMHKGLDVLFNLFAEERHAAFIQVRGFLQSDSYREGMNDLQGRFNVPDGMSCGNSANEATGHFAGRMIMKRYGKVARLARSITKETPDEKVHALRIQCKKLRYLMEFFAPLYDADAVKPLVKSLKGLQDGLGHFNDCSVQRAALSAFVEEHPMRGKKGLVLAESVGALVATLYQKQLRARSQIDGSLAAFANEKTNQHFMALFADGDSR